MALSSQKNTPVLNGVEPYGWMNAEHILNLKDAVLSC